MGHGSWNANEWTAYARDTVAGRSRAELFGARVMHPDYDPAGIACRESRDSGDNPNATPIIIGIDVTGSMGMLAEELVVRGLNQTFTALIDRQPVSNPHVMAMAIGDAYCDRAPLQVTQFEADLRIVEQLRQLWLEGGGGGNRGESYTLAHAFAGLKTVHDTREKRGRKGFLFTVGDEPVLDAITQDQLVGVLGIDARRELASRDAVRLANDAYDIFHIIVDGSYAARNMAEVRRSWEAILPGRVLHLPDPTRLAELIVATIERTSRTGAGGASSGPVRTSGLLPAAMRYLAGAGR